MFGTVGFARPAGFLLLGPTAVCVAPTPSGASAALPDLASTLPNLASIRLNRLDTGARG